MSEQLNRNPDKIPVKSGASDHAGTKAPPERAWDRELAVLGTLPITSLVALRPQTAGTEKLLDKSPVTIENKALADTSDRLEALATKGKSEPDIRKRFDIQRLPSNNSDTVKFQMTYPPDAKGHRSSVELSLDKDGKLISKNKNSSFDLETGLYVFQTKEKGLSWIKSDGSRGKAIHDAISDKIICQTGKNEGEWFANGERGKVNINSDGTLAYFSASEFRDGKEIHGKLDFRIRPDGSRRDADGTIHTEERTVTTQDGRKVHFNTEGVNDITRMPNGSILDLENRTRTRRLDNGDREITGLNDGMKAITSADGKVIKSVGRSEYNRTNYEYKMDPETKQPWIDPATNKPEVIGAKLVVDGKVQKEWAKQEGEKAEVSTDRTLQNGKSTYGMLQVAGKDDSMLTIDRQLVTREYAPHKGVPTSVTMPGRHNETTTDENGNVVNRHHHGGRFTETRISELDGQTTIETTTGRNRAGSPQTKYSRSLPEDSRIVHHEDAHTGAGNGNVRVVTTGERGRMTTAYELRVTNPNPTRINQLRYSQRYRGR